jgi:predicted small integral membrane protein
MTLRIVKVALVSGVAIFYTLVVFNNITDYDSNYQFVRHVLTMDSTFPGNRRIWRALNYPSLHTAFYLFIIAWESVTMLLCWRGCYRLFQALRRDSSEFHRAKRISMIALSLGLMMWLVAFLSAGGEWFLMWQSKTWNGQDAAFRMFAVIGIVLLILMQPESADQP